MVSVGFRYEKLVWNKGYDVVAGIDEVGRGAFAGPVVCGCVVFPSQYSKSNIPNTIRIDDSKKLTDRQRRISAVWIKKNCLSWGIGSASVSEINKHGISKATASGFRRAISGCNSRMNIRINYLLIDAFFIPYIRNIHIPNKKQRKRKKEEKIRNNSQQLAIINGDEKSMSIAAASIIAKVYRDNLMIKFSKNKRYRLYHWEKNKGYGTKVHKGAIKKYGISRNHRKKFIHF